RRQKGVPQWAGWRTQVTDDKRREEFEAWAITQPEGEPDECKRDDIGHYKYSDVAYGWKAWNAAFAAGEKSMRERAARITIWLRGRMTHLSFSITGNDHALFDEYHDVEASLQSYRERAIEDAVDLARVPQLSPSAEMPACEQLEKVVDLQKRQFNDYVERNGNGCGGTMITFLKAEEQHQHPNGGGWVANTAKAEPSAYVGPNAQVSGDARVSGNAQVFDNAQAYGNAWVFGDARVYGDARVSGNARVCDNAWET